MIRHYRAPIRREKGEGSREAWVIADKDISSGSQNFAFRMKLTPAYERGNFVY